jgi:nucleotide-binding universal stress UspA family protein
MGTVNFKKIIIATDGFECSKQVVDKGIGFAQLSGGVIYAVFVVSTAYFSSMDGDYISSMGMYSYWEAIHEALKKQGPQAVDYVKGSGR